MIIEHMFVLKGAGRDEQKENQSIHVQQYDAAGA
jgi:hypothetical protein